MWSEAILVAIYFLFRLVRFLVVLAGRCLLYGLSGVRARLTGKPQPQRKSLKSQLMDDWKAWIERREREEDEKLQRFQDWFHPDDPAKRP